MEPRNLTRRAFLTVPADRPADADFLVRVQRQMMACRVEVVLPGEHSDQLPLASEALDEGDRLEQVLTFFRESSELSVVNRTAHLEPVRVGPELFAILQIAADLHEFTEGAFDVTATPLSRCWGFLRREGRLPVESEIEHAREMVGMHLVELDRTQRTVYFRRPGVCLNLGSIGKGFVLDRMGRFLRERGVNHALLSAGSSSIVAIGGSPRRWDVDLRSITAGCRLARLKIATGAVGTSGAGEQFFEAGGARYGHVIDPRTGWPASSILSASVISSSGAAADALSTAFMIGGAELAGRYCASHPGVLAIVTPEASRTPSVFGSYLAASVELT